MRKQHPLSLLIIQPLHQILIILLRKTPHRCSQLVPGHLAHSKLFHCLDEPVENIWVLREVLSSTVGIFQNADVLPGLIQHFHELIHRTGIVEAVMGHSRKEPQLSGVNLHRAALVQFHRLLQQLSAGIVIHCQMEPSQQLVK